MNIMVIGNKRFADHLRKIFEKELKPGEDAAVFVNDDDLDNCRVVRNLCRYDSVIVDISGKNRRNSGWQRKISGFLEMNLNMIVVCISSRDLVDVSLFERMDLSRIIIMKCPRSRSDEAELIAALEAGIENKVRNSELKLCVSNKYSQQCIPCSLIIYAMKARSGLKVKTVRGEFNYRKRMDEFEEKIMRLRCFCRCHNSYIVNFKYVSKIENNDIYLSNGDIVPISRTYRSSVRSFASRDHSDEEEQNE